MDPYRRSKEVLKGTTPSQAATEGNLAILETYNLTGWDFSKVDDQGKTPLQHAVEQEQCSVFAVLGVKLGQKNDSAFAALKVNGNVVAWGAQENGGDASKVQAQLVDVQSIYSTDYAFAALKADGSVVTWGDEDCGGDCSKVHEQ